jgi:hypothetical protein
MAVHEVTFTIPQKVALSNDVEFVIKSDGEKLGTLMISKGNIEWMTAGAKVKKSRLSWEKFAEVMENSGKAARKK